MIVLTTKTIPIIMSDNDFCLAITERGVWIFLSSEYSVGDMRERKVRTNNLYVYQKLRLIL